jgi:ATP-dependent RNA helicase RhlE
VDIVVATPGRLLDHFQHQYAAMKSLEVLVLDEADRMLDIGFLPDIRRVLKHVPTQRQTLMFSATLPAEIVTLSREILRNPVSVEVGRVSTAPAGGITHAMYPVPSNLKSALLAELLKRGEIKSVIVFTRTKHRANRVADFLAKNGIEAGRIHGNRSQGQRTDALAALKSGRIPVLIATDIAARGIDVEALSHVVNFDVPNSPEDYVHRAGRTARADMMGDAFLFVAPEEEQSAARIERAIGKRIPRVIVPGFDYRSKAEALEIPLGQRLAAMRAQRSAGHARRTAGSAPSRPAGARPAGGHRPSRGPNGRPTRSGQGYGGGGGRSHGSRG